jgi:hypothetical protein
MSAKADLERRCRELAASLADDMAAEGLKGKTLTLKLKATSFEVGLMLWQCMCYDEWGEW